MSNLTTLTDAQLAVLAAELAQGSPDPQTRGEPFTPYAADDQAACDELNAQDRPYEVPVELDSMLEPYATQQGRLAMGLTEYLASRDRIIVIQARAENTADTTAQSAAVSTLAWLSDPVDRDTLASNATTQKILTALGPAGSSDLSQADLDWINNWGLRQRSRMEELRTPEGSPLPIPCRVVWVTEARAS